MQTLRVVGLKWSGKRLTWIVTIVALLVIFWLSLPSPLFDDPYATVVYDRHGRLLGARIAGDGQWRFPPADSVPDKFTTCLLRFEDRHFYRHPGFNPVSLGRALWQNIRAGKVVSGGSTLTMQTIRLSRKGKPRTVWEKVLEIWLAFRLEVSYSKNSILGMYASHAPFGGNNVGLGAASWRYFGRPPSELSWAEAAVLAVLPNAPSAIHPGKNRDVLLKKRNRLLNKLMADGRIDEITCNLACDEPLPQDPLPLPNNARHFVARLTKQQGGEQIMSTIDAGLQEKVSAIARRNQPILAANQVFNAAIMVMDLNSGEVLAYLGNSADQNDSVHSPDVDIIVAPRSSGSILKPFLYAAMMDAGELLPGMLVPDVPSYFSGFSPKNFSQTYDGAVPARLALSRSLNIPAVYLLKEYGVQPFYDLLKKLGMTTLNKPASHYGLSLILGGAEASLWDVCSMYSNMGRTLKGTPSPGMESPAYSAGAAWLTLHAMCDVNRPEEEEGWRAFASSRNIAWKTGTSFGFRDAWSVGMTADYLVGVWVGNAGGEGRPGLTGVSAAAPLMFEVFRVLPAPGHWFPEPFDELEKTEVCRQSGYRPSVYCPERDSVTICLEGLKSMPCPYHRLLQLDETGQYRVNADCYPSEKIVPTPWFILPPALGAYYRLRDPFYRPVPPLLSGCSDDRQKLMQFIYPAGDKKILIPHEQNGRLGEVIFEAAHQIPSTIIYWHLDDEYLGFTRDIHKMSLQPPQGKHNITLVDENGNRLVTEIEVVQ
ncbi:MAG: penicillin-binding protein 1C [Bacteroidales bacterium]|nr:penicillin-binding protein 1C [Bacteroidales bacterium]